MSSKSSKLFDLLSDLAREPKKAKAFNQNPNAVFEEYEIDEEMADLIASGDLENSCEGRKAGELYGRKAP